MTIIPTFIARATAEALPRGCKPFSLQDSVCVGDLIAILACSISGLGFFFWAIHAVYKMRHEFPFNFKEEDQVMPIENPPFYFPSANDNSILSQKGVRKPPNVPDRVRTRMFFTYPKEEFYQHSAFIPPDAYGAGTPPTVEMPRRPPPAGGRSKRTSSHRPGRHASLLRAGPSGDYEDYYLRDASRTRGLPSSGYDYCRMDGKPMMYGH